MSNGNLKKFKLTRNLIASRMENTTEQSSPEATARVYRKKNSRVKKALNFETKGTKAKLV